MHFHAEVYTRIFDKHRIIKSCFIAESPGLLARGSLYISYGVKDILSLVTVRFRTKYLNSRSQLLRETVGTTAQLLEQDLHNDTHLIPFHRLLTWKSESELMSKG